MVVFGFSVCLAGSVDAMSNIQTSPILQEVHTKFERLKHSTNHEAKPHKLFKFKNMQFRIWDFHKLTIITAPSPKPNHQTSFWTCWPTPSDILFLLHFLEPSESGIGSWWELGWSHFCRSVCCWSIQAFWSL